MRPSVLILTLPLFALANLQGMVLAHTEADPESQAQGQLAQQAAPGPMIVLQGDLLSVRVHDAAWGTVIQELERHTGILIRIEGTLAGTVTEDFQAVPLEQGLRRLFRNANLLFFYATGQPRPSSVETLIHVWLFPKKGGVGKEARMPAASTSATAEKPGGGGLMGETTAATSPADGEVVAEADDQEKRLTTLEVLAQQGDVDALQQAVFDPDQTIQVAALELLAERHHQEAIILLLDATKSDQPERRFQALTLLHHSRHADERTILAALGEALADADASVKLYAIQALGERRGSAALGSLRHALRDPDPSIRMIVIDRLVPEGQGLELLQEALADDEKMVRELAASRLEEAEQ